jgi:hypothetical protein
MKEIARYYSQIAVIILDNNVVKKLDNGVVKIIRLI